MATKQEKLALREQGMTYQQIADHFGISYQAVAQTLAKYNPNHFQYVTEAGCAYPGLRNWMNDNKAGRSELIRRCHIESTHQNLSRMRNYLTCKADPPKRVIDKILGITGLTYEEAFGL